MVTDHAGKIRAIPINGVEPTYENISSGTYLGTRPLYLYIKSNNIGRTPGLKEFLAEISSEEAWGEKGYLRAADLVTMPASERASYVAKLKEYGVSAAAAKEAAPAKKDKAKGKTTKGKEKEKASAKKTDGKN